MGRSNVLVASEKDVQAAIVDWIGTVPGVYVWRQNVGSKDYRKPDGSRGVVFFGQRGMSDLTGMANGIRLEIEVKRAGKEPSDDQILWLQIIRQRGGIAFWADSLDSCVRQLREAFEDRGMPWAARWEI